MQRSDQNSMPGIELSVPLKTVCHIISMAREFDVKDVDSELGDGSNPTDDGSRSVLEDHGDDPVFEELTSIISDLNEDEQIELVALMWLGRDDYVADNWAELCEQASDAHNERTAQYLLSGPLLSDYLEEGLSLLGYSCSELEGTRVSAVHQRALSSSEATTMSFCALTRTHLWHAFNMNDWRAGSWSIR